MLTHTNQTDTISIKIFQRFLTKICRRIAKTIRPASKVNIIARIFFSTSNVATTSAPKENPITKIIPGKPSRYITTKKLAYTNANPVSFCKIEINAGDIANTAAINCDCNFVKSIFNCDRYFASARAANTLHNSAGCKLKPPPNGIQLLEPFIFLPITNTDNISMIPNTYIRFANAG